MTLQEAVVLLKKEQAQWGEYKDADYKGFGIPVNIATILNAVVKGELRHDNDR